MSGYQERSAIDYRVTLDVESFLDPDGDLVIRVDHPAKGVISFYLSNPGVSRLHKHLEKIMTAERGRRAADREPDSPGYCH